MEQKYIIFLAALLVGIPVGIFLTLHWRRIHDLVFAAIVLGTAHPHEFFGFSLDINLISREWYRGTTRGTEISYLDLLAIILLVSSLVIRGREGRRLFWPPSLGFLLAYFAWCAINVGFLSDPKLFGVFELTKIARGILLFVAVAFYVRGPRELRFFLWTLVVGICYQAGISLHERYIVGRHRIAGTIEHPNSLSMYSLQYVPIFIALFFSQDIPSILQKVSILAYAAAAGCVILSISRAGFAVLILLSAAGFVLGAGLRLNARNLVLASMGTLIITLMTAKAWETTMSRLGGFDLDREYTEEGDRGSYFYKAAPAIAENPIFGVGLNNWSYWISNRYAVMAGYRNTPYIDTNTPPDVTPHAPAHNLYLITVTELGWPGLVLLLALFGRWLWLSGSAILTRGESWLARFRVGVFLSLMGVMMQSWTEWIFRQTSMYFLGHIIMAVAAVLYFHRDRAGSA